MEDDNNIVMAGAPTGPSMTFKRITINLVPNITYILEPYEYIYIDDESRRVVFYRIRYIDATNAHNNIVVEIPYYISDGHTNHFRANMAYPFICFKDPVSHESCPYQDASKSNILIDRGLYKLNIGTNFNNRKISDWIEAQIVDKIDIVSVDSITSGDYVTFNTYAPNARVGIRSVLPRITNIVDYLITISSPAIVDVTDIRNYRPVFTPGRFYDMGFRDDISNRANYGLSVEITPEQFTSFLRVSDLYRQKLLIALNDQITNLQNGIITLDDIELVPSLLTMQQFNTTLAICSRLPKNPFNRISNYHIENIGNYSIISHRLYDNFITYCDTQIVAISVIVATPAETERKRFLQTFRAMFPSLPPAVPVPGRVYLKYNGATLNDLLPNNIAGWNAKCQKKYLKYKQKYLALKKKLNIQ